MQDLNWIRSEVHLGLLLINLFNLWDSQPHGVLIEGETKGADGAAQDVPDVTMGVLKKALGEDGVLAPALIQEVEENHVVLFSTYPVQVINVLAYPNVHLDVT